MKREGYLGMLFMDKHKKYNFIPKISKFLKSSLPRKQNIL